MKIFFDGGCRPNPGRMELAVVARGVVHHVADAGLGSSEKAEWLALLHALEVAEMLGEKDVLLLGDAVSIINQVQGRTRSASPDLQAFHARATGFDRIRVRHVKRTQNLAGITLGQLRNAPDVHGLGTKEGARH